MVQADRLQGLSQRLQIAEVLPVPLADLDGRNASGWG